jgi:hypothetical protein
MGQIDQVSNQNAIASQKLSNNALQVMQLTHTIKQTSDKLLEFLSGGKELSDLSYKNGKNTVKSKIKEKVLQPSKEIVSTKVRNESSLETKTITQVKRQDNNEKIKKVKSNFLNKTNEARLPSYDDSRFEDV